ncbi:MAG: hypothetical protein HYX67_03915 [Candidatus Melainabacteria bacterium]|nr:hypothetical protein [Candidatus Melainabacteria bacterium]
MSSSTESAGNLIFPRVISAILAIAALSSCYFGFQEVAFFGFPDGHITDYEKAATPALKALFATLAPFGVYFLTVTVSSAALIRSKGWFGVAAGCAVLILLVINLGIPWYFGTHLALDNGVGG